MDRVLDLPAILNREVADYVASSFDSTLFYSENPSISLYMVTVLPNDPHERPHVMIMARLIGNKIVILIDTTDRPLYKELLRVGIPREQITLAYAGETPPQP